MYVKTVTFTNIRNCNFGGDIKDFIDLVQQFNKFPSTVFPVYYSEQAIIELNLDDKVIKIKFHPKTKQFINLIYYKKDNLLNSSEIKCPKEEALEDLNRILTAYQNFRETMDLILI